MSCFFFRGNFGFAAGPTVPRYGVRTAIFFSLLSLCLRCESLKKGSADKTFDLKKGFKGFFDRERERVRERVFDKYLGMLDM